MDATKTILSLLVSICFTIGHVMDYKVVSVMEGSTAIFNCSGNANESIWYVSWVFTPNNDSRKEITTCYDRSIKEGNKGNNSRTCNEENTCDRVPHCAERTDIQNNAFTSQLRIQNVTADLRQHVIECIMGDTLYYETYVIMIMGSFILNVYHLSNTSKCNAILDNNDAIEVSCEILKVYPEIICRIFPEVRPTLESEIHVTKLPEISDVTYVKHRLEESIEYYVTYCNTKYYPKQVGNFRFHVDLYQAENLVNPVLNISTDYVQINSISAYSKMRNGDKMTETDTAFYVLMGSILILGVTVILIVSWVIWIKRSTCRSSPNANNQNNYYESIDPTVHYSTAQNVVPVSLTDEGYGESATGGTMFSDSENEEDIYARKLLEEGGYLPNCAPPRPHVTRVTDNGANKSNNEYIVPTTPTSTISRSPVKESTLDTSFHDDNYSETHSKLFFESPN